jgi:AraC-like DNA-binding protein
MAERLYVRLEDDPLYAPETSVPAGALREFAVPAPLRAQVAHVMAYAEQLPPDVEVQERVLPDGALRLIIELEGDTPTARIAGPSTAPVLLSLRGAMQGLSLTLRPGAAAALFGLPAHALAERVEAWDDIVPARQRGLAERLRESPDDAARVRLLGTELQAMLRRPPGDDQRRAADAARLLRQGAQQRSVRAVAQALGVGERRLQQIFRAQLGLSPRAFGRLARLHDCLRLLRRPAAMPWAELALEGGFYDQSHLVNEFRALCGLTPEQFLRRTISRSSKTPG